MSALGRRESEEGESWDTRGDNSAASTVPGGFGPSDRELDALETERERAKRSRTRHVGVGLHTDDYEKAPIGLFEVARGAARTISKNAFPLRSAAAGGSGRPTGPKLGNVDSAVRSEDASSFGNRADGEAGRVRKRDVVSNMVTGGLVSGIGWVLGAQPVTPNTKQDR